MVTGKNKKQFEKWYDKFTTYGTIITFRGLPFEMKIGVYLDYYYSKGVFVDVVSYGNQSYWMPIVDYILESEHKTRTEAYKEAFKQADELMNK